MKIVYTCLVGDLFHFGHVNFLKKAREEGDYLIVGVCSDEDCCLYKREPIMSYEERLPVIASCKYVDEIIEKPPSVVTDEFINFYKIDLIVHGDDSNIDQLKYFYHVAISANKYKSLSYTSDVSTTKIIDRIKNRSKENLTRKNFLRE